MVLVEIYFNEFCDVFDLYDKKKKFSFQDKVSLYEYYSDYLETIDCTYSINIGDICNIWEKAKLEDYDKNKLTELKKRTDVLLVDKFNFLYKKYK